MFSVNISDSASEKHEDLHAYDNLKDRESYVFLRLAMTAMPFEQI